MRRSRRSGEAARAEVDRYLRGAPRVGAAPLFPSDTAPAEPIRADVATRKLLRAERLASLPKLRGGGWHPYRRLWATERKMLPVQDVAAAGGWKSTQTVARIYQQSDPRAVLDAVQFQAQAGR